MVPRLQRLAVQRQRPPARLVQPERPGPAELGKNGRPYVWVGEWCSAACLAGSMADLETAELRARLAYEADMPIGREAAS